MAKQVWSMTMGLAVLLLGSGCASRIYFTQSLRDRFERGIGVSSEPGALPAKPDQLQYFASRRIELLREANSRHDTIAGGRVVVRRGRMLEQVVIRRGTPGVATAWGPDWVEVSFEKGSSLRFAREGRQPEGEELPPHLVAGAREASGDYVLVTVPGRGKFPETVMFDGRGWTLGRWTEGARLRVKRRAFNKSKRARRVLRGRRL